MAIRVELETVKISRSFERTRYIRLDFIRQKLPHIRIPCDAMWCDVLWCVCGTMCLQGRRRGRRPRRSLLFKRYCYQGEKRWATELNKSHGMHRQWQTCRRCCRLALHSRSLFRGWDRERTSCLVMNLSIEL